MLRYSIGIDIGTGSTKAVALDEKGIVLTTAQEHYAVLHPQPGWAEQEPQVIWKAFAACLSAIIKALDTIPAVVCLSSQMHSLLLVDEQHKPLTNSILWSDNRSAAVAEQLRSSGEGAAIYTCTGTPVHSMSPLCKLLWLKENEPALFAKAARFISIKEWIWMQLFGEAEVDWAIASATGLFNHQTFSWDEEALSQIVLIPERLGSLVSTTHIRRGLQMNAADLLRLPVDTPFCIGGSDGCLANVGSAALDAGTAAITIGTSAAVRIASAQPVVDTAAMPFSYVLDKELFICGAPVNNGGNIAQWLQQQFLNGEKSYDELLQQTASIALGSDGLLCLPYLYGERAPVWDEAAAGAFIGVRPHHTQSHFVRAALEGVCYSLRQIVALLENYQPIHTIHASGGFVQSMPWLQLLADVCGKTIRVTQTEDASAIGAALWGWKALCETVAVNTTNALTIKPNATAQAVYNSVFPAYQTLYPALKPIFRQHQ